MNRKSLIIALIAVVVILSLIPNALALSFSATMTPSSTTVPEATEFTVTIKVSNIDAGVNGINSLTGYLTYDQQAFETISESSIDGLHSWTVNYASDTGKITLLKSSFVKSEEEVFQITFRTKTSVDASHRKPTISYKNIVASNSETDISASDISTTINIGDTPTVNVVNNTTPKNVNVTPITPAPVNTNTNTNRNNTVANVRPNNNTNTNNTVKNAPVENKANTDVPYTGANDNIVRIIFVVLVIAAVSYFKFQSLNDEKND